MLLLVSFGLVSSALVSSAQATTALHDDFDDGSLLPWRPVIGSWFESGGVLTGSQDTPGSGLVTFAEYNSLKQRVTLTTHPSGGGVAGIIYATSSDGDWCGAFYGHGDVWIGNSDDGEVQVLDGEDPGTDPTFVVVVDRDDLYVTVDGVDLYTESTNCSITRISGDVGLATLSASGEVTFEDFDLTIGGRDRDGDGVQDSEDCAPDDPTISSAATEIWYDGVDQNCDDRDDNDQDGDGTTVDTDCDDTDTYTHPGAEDLWYDGKDTDCGGNDDYDADSDGHQFDGVGGDDCNDGDATIYPGSPADEHDGVDHDCDGFIPAPGTGDTGVEDTAGDSAGDSATGNGSGDSGCACATGAPTAPGLGLAGGLLALRVAMRRRRG